MGGPLGGVVLLGTAGTAGFELVSRGVLPGKTVLDQFDGACSVPAPDLTLRRALPETAEVYFGNGCHSDPFFTAQEPPSLAFLARHLA